MAYFMATASDDGYPSSNESEPYDMRDDFDDDLDENLGFPEDYDNYDDPRNHTPSPEPPEEDDEDDEDDEAAVLKTWVEERVEYLRKELVISKKLHNTICLTLIDTNEEWDQGWSDARSTEMVEARYKELASKFTKEAMIAKMAMIWRAKCQFNKLADKAKQTLYQIGGAYEQGKVDAYGAGPMVGAKRKREAAHEVYSNPN